MEDALAALQWHRGRAEEHHHGQLHAVVLVDPRDGPAVEKAKDSVFIAHGGPAGPLALLQRGHSRFAALEWDGKILRASRDSFGQAPLFYRRLDGALWFSTEIRPLVALGAAAPDLHALAAFAATVEYPERTGWQGIYRVLPGEMLEVQTDRRITASRYWEPSRPRRASLSYASVVERVGELLHRAVERTLSGNVGVLLSGGLDSSAVAAIAARLDSPTLVAVTYPTLPELDETEYAVAVANGAGSKLHKVEGRLDRWDPIEDLDTFGVPPLRLPTGTYDSALPEMSGLGCDVALDGHDGDGALGNPYAELANIVLDGRPWRLAGVARHHGWPQTLRGTVKELLPPTVHSRLLRLPERSTGDHYLPYFRGPIQERIIDLYRWRPPREGWRREQYRVFLPPATQIIEETETLGARYGIDVRHPFADRDLVEFLGALPHSIKLSPARPKPILRDAVGDRLPGIVADRVDKAEFSAVVDRRVDYEACFRWVRDSDVRLAELDYGRLFRDASKPQNSRLLWTRLASVHLFLAGAGR